MKTLTGILVISALSFAAMAQEEPFPKDTQGTPNRILPPDTQKIITVPMDTGKTRQLNQKNQNPHIGPTPENNPKKNKQNQRKDPKKGVSTNPGNKS